MKGLMAGFSNTIRGNGLITVDRALADLTGDPQRLDHARVRFDQPPPPYISDRSGTTTRSQSPNPPSEEQQRRHERRTQLALDHRASEPYHQFHDQTRDEEKRIVKADSNGTCRLRRGDKISKIAYENVKMRWVEQGIWSDKWTMYALGRWKHEEPLQGESESETDTEAVPSPPPFSFSTKQPQLPPRQLKTDDGKRRIAERRHVRALEREASRPYHQFIYQMSKAREQIQQSTIMGSADTAGINTRAYEHIQHIWSKRGIWNSKWGIMPGMSWKHEELLQEECADSPAPIEANPVEGGNYEVERTSSFRNTNGAPLLENSGTSSRESGFFTRSSANETNSHQASTAVNISLHGATVGIDSTRTANGGAEPSSPAPNSPGLQIHERALGSTVSPTTRKSFRSSQLQPVAGVSFGPIRPSKVSKAAAKKKPGSRRQTKVAKEVSSNGLLLSSRQDVAGPLHQATIIYPRRSTRIKSKPSLPNDASGTTLTHLTNDSRQRQNAVGRVKCFVPAKPQGVTKRRSTKTTLGMLRKYDA